MGVHIALLRGVNVGGKLVAMAALRELAARLQLDDARTLLNSGNLVFRSARKAAALEKLLEEETRKTLGLATRFLLRSPAEWDAMIAANPFPGEAKSAPARLVAVALAEAPSAAAADALAAAIRGPEMSRVIGRTAYVVYPAGIGTSKLTLTAIERALATTGTARNWNTVLKLSALARSLAESAGRK
ncbi:MAG TPA: DUF1697 domain-containing protein [Bauldia sp.]|nr:DUF1697 domain-containing protein [Bauldia sp.]